MSHWAPWTVLEGVVLEVSGLTAVAEEAAQLGGLEFDSLGCTGWWNG